MYVGTKLSIMCVSIYLGDRAISAQPDSNLILIPTSISKSYPEEGRRVAGAYLRPYTYQLAECRGKERKGREKSNDDDKENKGRKKEIKQKQTYSGTGMYLQWNGKGRSLTSRCQWKLNWTDLL